MRRPRSRPYVSYGRSLRPCLALPSAPRRRSVSVKQVLTTPLRELFGFDAFRPGQEEVVRAAIEGRDTLALMPTGSGKSLTYQLAAMLRPEPTLVLSPLIALMKDQVDKLPPKIAATATFVNSSLSVEESAARLERVASGETRLVYAAPERLRQARFVEMLRTIGIGLVVVDEVHCVSMWGHDFRPDYLFIRRGLEELGGPTMLGMTATATPEIAREIGVALGREPEVVHTSVVRPNLRYDVARVANVEDRLQILVERLRSPGRWLGDRLRALAPFDGGGGEGSPRARIPRRALPRGARVRGAHTGAGRLRRRSHPGRRRDDGVRHGHRQARRAARLPRQLPRLARGLRADGRPSGARRCPQRDAPAREPERRGRASALRGLGRARAVRSARDLPSGQRHRPRHRSRRARRPRPGA